MAAECSPGGRGGEPPTLPHIVMSHFPEVHVMRLPAGWPRLWSSGRSAKRAAVLLLTAMVLHVPLPLPWHAASPARVVARETATVAAVVDPFADVVPEA